MKNLRMRVFMALLAATVPFLAHSQVPASLNMSLLGRWQQDTLRPCTGNNRCYSDLWGYTDCQGNEYALVGAASTVSIVNITNPAAPELVYEIAGGNVTTWRDIQIFRNRLYACVDGGNEGLIILDLSGLPDSVHFVKQTPEFFTKAHTIFIDEPNGRLYATGTDTRADGLIILDLNEDPDNPVLIGSPSLPGGGYMHESFVRDNVVYGSHGFNGFYVWDCTDAQNPVLKASITNVTGYNHTSWLTDDNRYAYFSEEVPAGQPLYIVDLANLNNGEMEIVGTFKTPLLAPDHLNNIYHNTIIRDNYFIVTAYEDGTQIFDITDPLNPQLVAYYDTNPINEVYNGYFNNWGIYPFFPSGNLILSDMQTGLYIVKADSLTFDALYPPNPPLPTITVIDDILKADIADAYQWFYEGVAIEGATAQTLQPTLTGNYAVRITNLTGCSTTSAPTFFQVTGIGEVATAEAISLSPNPADVQLSVSLTANGLTPLQFLVYNATGQLVQSQHTSAIGTARLTVPTQQLPNGIYTLQVLKNGQPSAQKFVVKH